VHIISINLSQFNGITRYTFFYNTIKITILLIELEGKVFVGNFISKIEFDGTFEKNISIYMK
jgi:hypothetical protein